MFVLKIGDNFLPRSGEHMPWLEQWTYTSELGNSHAHVIPLPSRMHKMYCFNLSANMHTNIAYIKWHRMASADSDVNLFCKRTIYMSRKYTFIYKQFNFFSAITVSGWIVFPRSCILFRFHLVFSPHKIVSVVSCVCVWFVHVKDSQMWKPHSNNNNGHFRVI